MFVFKGVQRGPGINGVYVDLLKIAAVLFALLRNRQPPRNKMRRDDFRNVLLPT
jgi:hypothetical protein